MGMALSADVIKVSIHAPLGGATRRARAHRHRKPVSIHAPLGGATEFIRKVRDKFYVSIHAPLGGATRAPCPLQ